MANRSSLYFFRKILRAEINNRSTLTGEILINLKKRKQKRESQTSKVVVSRKNI